MANKSDTCQDYTGRYTIGSRLSFDGALCTVRYIGPVQGTKGEWLGVEWDEPDRGKHAGAHNGVKYFQCRNNHPTAGSFVRLTRPSDKSLSFLEGAHEKYVSELPVFHSSFKGDHVVEDYMSKPIEISGKIVEEVGFDEVRKQLAALHELRILILDGLRINGVLAGPDVSDNREKELEKIKHTCPKVMELDLSRNLIRRWCEIVDICAQLPELKILKLNGNFIEDIKNCSSATVSHTVNSLFLDFTLMDWEEIATVSHRFPSLASLSLENNQLSSVSAPLSAMIQELLLDFNDFESLDSLSHLTALRKLRHLSLRRNKISKIYTSMPSDMVFSPTLEFVDLSCNQISSWSFLDSLQKVFPGMIHLRISDNPLYSLPPAPTKVTGLPEARMTVDEAFMLTLSRLSSLKILNYGKITPLDRLNGELYYLSLIRKEVLAYPSSMEQEIIRSHPRYKELCKTYETPEIQRTEKDEQSRDIDPRSLAAQLIKFRFHLADSSKVEEKANAHVFEKEIPRSFDVYLIKAIVARHFSLPAVRFKLIWESDEWDLVEKGTAEEDEWDSEEEEEDDDDEDTRPINSKPEPKANEKGFVRREEELTDSTREVSHWFASDVKEANIRVEPF
ncbi:Tubulin-specific chaperone E [Trichophyton interdigitale]|uniref:Tubulin-specific chaperone E n=1 Tax=Trichophyton interdigitale TaxID=101480 RepID=A0A9P4YFY0_9EURO|nr:Tubulin-specific chaperone E [Trichophyton interdigitale]KAF3897798.1 Tubulin-specific chaperone E [Trichophyton interdigitale]KAG8209173.1 Tubulin-specific chaperone E [Trichophyton interdigitale]